MNPKFNREEQQGVWNAIAKGWSGWRNMARKDVIQFSEDWKIGKLLDIGCGSGRNLFYFASKGFDFYGIDFSKNMIREARKNLEKSRINLKPTKSRQKNERLIAADMTDLPFSDESFDYCISIASFHHLPKERQKKGLDEINRVLKKDGECVISVWNKYSFKHPGFWFSPKETFVVWKRKENGTLKPYNRYYYLFSYSEFKKLILKSGFRIKKSSGRFDENITFLIKKKE